MFSDFLLVMKQTFLLFYTHIFNFSSSSKFQYYVWGFVYIYREREGGRETDRQTFLDQQILKSVKLFLLCHTEIEHFAAGVFIKFSSIYDKTVYTFISLSMLIFF